MNAQLEKQFNQLEDERKNLFGDLKKYSDETLNKKPSPQTWSVAEVIGHLMTSEELSLKYLQKKTLDTSKAQPEGWRNKWRWFLINIVFTFDIKFKAPDIVKPKLEFASLNDLENKWSKIRSETFQLVGKLSDEEVNKELWKHALAGKLNLHHMEQFFGIHFRRHRKQIERTLQAVT